MLEGTVTVELSSAKVSAMPMGQRLLHQTFGTKQLAMTIVAANIITVGAAAVTKNAVNGS